MIYRRLIGLHKWNGWNLLLLILTGVLLYIPELRGPLASIRVPLKWLHFGAGLLSIALLLLYLPHMRWHWERLRRRIGQKVNVVLLASLLVAWLVTGVIMWFNRYMPPNLAESALIWHDRLTWFAIPWVTIHAVTRYFKWQLVLVRTPLREERRVFLAGAAAVVGALMWKGLGRRLGLPGFETSNGRADLASAANSAGPVAQGHEPILDPSAFRPVPVGECPVGGEPKGFFRVYTVTPTMPVADAQTWTLKVGGLVERPQDYTWDQFRELPRTCQVSNFHCVTGWSVYNVKWEGVRLADLLDAAGVQSSAKYAKFYSGDGEYTDAVDLEVARMEDVILPFLLDGSPLPTQLGGPVRLIIPAMYGYKSVKWLREIELIAENHIGYWGKRGYPHDAWLEKA